MAAVAAPSPIEIARAELATVSAELERAVAQCDAAVQTLRDLVHAVEFALDVARAKLVEAEAGR